jgi:hypothetical protein
LGARVQTADDALKLGANESRSIFLLHRDKLHAHASCGIAPLHYGERPYLPCWYIKQ